MQLVFVPPTQFQLLAACITTRLRLSVKVEMGKCSTIFYLLLIILFYESAKESLFPLQSNLFCLKMVKVLYLSSASDQFSKYTCFISPLNKDVTSSCQDKNQMQISMPCMISFLNVVCTIQLSACLVLTAII